MPGSNPSRLSRFAQSRPLLMFFPLAYAWAWSFWLLVPRTLLRGTGSTSDVVELTLFLVGAFGPTVAALTTQWLSNRNFKICRLWTGWSLLLLGASAGLVSFFIASVVAPALSLVRAPVLGLNRAPLAHLSVYAINYSTFLGGPINEEPGWRGFALPKLQARFGPYVASLILGVFWSGWHMPLFFVEGWTTASP